jgi:hypothetical protein
MLSVPMVESNYEEERLFRIEQTLKYLVRSTEVLKQVQAPPTKVTVDEGRRRPPREKTR